MGFHFSLLHTQNNGNVLSKKEKEKRKRKWKWITNKDRDFELKRSYKFETLFDKIKKP